MKKDSIHSVTLLRRWCHRLGRLLPLLLPVLAAACQSGEDPVAVDGPYNVRLLIDPQSASTRADGDESLIHQLRVYVFNTAGKRVGYYENMALSATGQAYYVPFRLTEGGLLTFYVVANEGGASGTKESVLTEEMKLDDLQSYQFFTRDIDRTPGDLLTGEVTTNITGTQVNVIPCQLTRPFSLLNVYFAKTSESSDVQVTSVTLHDYSAYGYYNDRDNSYTADDRKDNNKEEPLTLLNTYQEITQTVTEDQQAIGNYGTSVTSQPVTLDRDGSTPQPWGDNKPWENIEPETETKPRLEIEYKVNNEEKNATVYLPPIEKTNCKYNVKCLIINETEVAVKFQWTVNPWVKKDIDVPTFS